jgi:two-component system response regulator RegX3
LCDVTQEPGPLDTILVAEDDPPSRLALVTALEQNGYQVIEAADGEQALALFADRSPDLVLLDIGLPRQDGFSVLKQIRLTSDVPVIFLTARDEEVDRVVGLELGADDYVVKPYSHRELVARVRARLRTHHRSSPAVVQPARGEGLLTYGDTVIDLRAREVTIDGKLVPFTSREFDLYSWLARHPREAFTRSQLLDSIWGTRYKDPATVTEHIRRVRVKLDDLGATQRLVTLRGAGYRFDP